MALYDEYLKLAEPVLNSPILLGIVLIIIVYVGYGIKYRVHPINLDPDKNKE
jgi:hypothetical protein